MRRLLVGLLCVGCLGCGGASYDPKGPLTPDYVKRDQNAGKDCSEIGAPYRIEPGVDPEHDRDGDGLACENEGDWDTPEWETPDWGG